MTKSEGSGAQNYSQDCSICLNSIAVCLPCLSTLRRMTRSLTNSSYSLANVYL